MIQGLFLAGVDVFRLNFSHGTHEQHRERLQQIRDVERSVGRPIGVLADMQGPKLRVGTFASGPVTPSAGSSLPTRSDEQTRRRNARVPAAPGNIRGAEARINLLDDGKLRLRVTHCTTILPRPRWSLAAHCRNAKE
jgi:pyruvate kinase